MGKIRTISAVFLNDGSGKTHFEFAGPSSETKPVGAQIATGSWFHEVDTTKVYSYIEDADAGEEWVEQIQLGGE